MSAYSSDVSLRTFSWRTGHRKLHGWIAFFVLLLLLLCIGHAPAKGEALYEQQPYDIAYYQEKAFVTKMLNWIDLDPKRDDQIRMGEWVIHPKGFAFRVPKEMELMHKPRGADVRLIDETRQYSSFTTILSVSTAAEDNGLNRWSDETIISLYRRQFARFELVDFSRGTPWCEGGFHIAYLCDNAPQKLTHQYVFIYNGYSFNVTFIMENRFASVAQGLRWFTTFCDSLIFRQADMAW